MFLCAELIEENIRLWDEYLGLEKRKQKEEEKERGTITLADEVKEQRKHKSKTQDTSPFQTHQIYLGASQGQVTFAAIEKEHIADPAFKHFRRRLKKYLEVFLNTPGNISTDSHIVGSYQAHPRLLPTDTVSYYFLFVHFTHIAIQITEFRYLEVDYESIVTSELESNLLRCNPMFHGQARYDYVIFNDTEGHIAFAQLIFMFTCLQVPMALVQPMDKGIGGRPRVVDKDLGFHRVKSSTRDQSRFIPLRSVLRGAMLCKDPASLDEYIVVDTINMDMFLRIRRLFPKRYQ